MTSPVTLHSTLKTEPLLWPLSTTRACSYKHKMKEKPALTTASECILSILLSKFYETTLLRVLTNFPCPRSQQKLDTVEEIRNDN